MTIVAICIFLFVMTGLVRLFLWKRKSIHIWHITIALSGLFGFLLCLPIGFYGPYSDPYLYITYAFLVEGLIGFIGCLVYDVNPFISEKREKIEHENHIAEKRKVNGATFVQTQTESRSLSLIGEALGKIQPPFYLYKGVVVERLGEEEEFKFVAISPSGIYHLYPCNWGDSIAFHNVGSKRNKVFEQDSKDYTIACSYRQELLKKVIQGNGFSSAPIIPLIVVTEPGVTFTNDAKNYEVVHLQDLVTRIQKPDNQRLTQQQIYDIKNIFENYIKK